MDGRVLIFFSFSIVKITVFLNSSSFIKFKCLPSYSYRFGGHFIILVSIRRRFAVFFTYHVIVNVMIV